MPLVPIAIELHGAFGNSHIIVFTAGLADVKKVGSSFARFYLFRKDTVKVPIPSVFIHYGGGLDLKLVIVLDKYIKIGPNKLLHKNLFIPPQPVDLPVLYEIHP